MNVLLIDDEVPIRRICRVYLERAGFLVCEAPEGLAGIEKARTYKPDLVLLDIQMPGLDGLTVARQLRADADTRAIPIIFLSPRIEFCACVNELGLPDVEAMAEPFNPLKLDRIAVRAVERAKAHGPTPHERLEALWSLRVIATTRNDRSVDAEVERWRQSRTLRTEADA